MTTDYIQKAEKAAERLCKEGRISKKDKERIIRAAADFQDRQNGSEPCFQKDEKAGFDGVFKAAKESVEKLCRILKDSTYAFVRNYSFSLKDGTVFCSRRTALKPWEKYETKTVSLHGTAEKEPFDVKFAVFEAEDDGLPESIPQSALPYVAVVLEEKFSGIVKVCKPKLCLKIKIE